MMTDETRATGLQPWEIDFQSSPPSTMVDVLRVYGATVLRSAISLKEIATIKSNLEAIYAMHRALKTGDPGGIAFFDKVDPALVDRVEDGNVAPQIYEKHFAPTASMYAFLRDPKFADICRGIFPSGKYAHQWLDTLMTVQPPSHTVGPGHDGIGLHTDGMYYDDTKFALTIWIPLDDCGRDAPGIMFVAAGHDEIRAYASFDRDATAPAGTTTNFHKYDMSKFGDRSIAEAFPENRIISPDLRRGDVCLFTNWSIHATHRHAAMTRARSALQLRIIGDAFDPLPKEV